jgi:hypothetical protein
MAPFNIVVAVGVAASASPQQTWRLANFGSAAVNNPALEAGLWGDDADPDHDGMRNWDEYCFGLDPMQPLQGTSQVLSISNGTVPGRVVLRYQRRTDDPRLTYRLQASTDLRTWSNSGMMIEGESVVAINAQMESCRLELRASLAPASHQFYRIVVLP